MKNSYFNGYVVTITVTPPKGGGVTVTCNHYNKLRNGYCNQSVTNS